MIDIATLIGILVGWTGVLAGVIKALVGRAMRDIDTRLVDYDKKVTAIAADCDRTDQDMKRVLGDYQRREDAIRETTALAARIDAVGVRVDSFVRRDDYLRHETVLNHKLDALAERLLQVLETSK